jgi:hypothetical protein
VKNADGTCSQLSYSYKTKLLVVVNCGSLSSGLCCEINSLTSLHAVSTEQVTEVLLRHLCQQLIYAAML